MSLRSEMRQNIQTELNFSSTSAGEAREAGREETESPRVVSDPESPASGRRWDDRRRDRRLSETALASHPGTTVERNLRAETGEEGGNPQAGRRGAQAWHPNGAGSVDPAGGDAGSAEAVGPDVFRLQLRVPAGAVGSAGSGTRAE